MITISSQVYDLDGVVIIDNLDEATDLRSGERRIERTALLDGGSEVFDGGYSDSDRTFTIAVRNPSKALAESLHRLQSAYDTVTLSTDEGVFSVALQRLSIRGDFITVTALVKERLSA